jgi:N-acyl homoserine lactone hydrolase
MNQLFHVLFEGFPGKSNRGFLGWSSAVLLNNRRFGLFDTAGFGERIELINRLRAQNVQPQDIDFIILSHFHFDHVANISLFPHAKVYLHESEVRHILEDSSVDLVVPVELFHSLYESGRLVILRGEKGVVENYDWFRTPGHTPGCISISFQQNGETFVLAADAIKNLLEAQTGEVWMSTNPEMSRESIKKILDRADWILPGHDRLLHVRRTDHTTFIEAAGESKVDIAFAKDYPNEVSVQIHEEDGGQSITIGVGGVIHGV